MSDCLVNGIIIGWISGWICGLVVAYFISRGTTKRILKQRNQSKGSITVIKCKEKEKENE